METQWIALPALEILVFGLIQVIIKLARHVVPTSIPPIGKTGTPKIGEREIWTPKQLIPVFPLQAICQGGKLE